MKHCFYHPHNLIDPPPCITRIKNAIALQGQKSICGKSASKHNFSGLGCNFRVFQDNSRGKRIPGSFRVGWPPWRTHQEMSFLGIGVQLFMENKETIAIHQLAVHSTLHMSKRHQRHLYEVFSRTKGSLNWQKSHVNSTGRLYNKNTIDPCQIPIM